MTEFDIAIEGRSFFSITGETDYGRSWIDEFVEGAESGAACSDDSRYTLDIADGAVDDGLRVSINGEPYRPESEE